MMDLFFKILAGIPIAFFYLDGCLHLFQITDFLLAIFPADMITFTYLISHVQSVHFNHFSVAKV